MRDTYGSTHVIMVLITYVLMCKYYCPLVIWSEVPKSTAKFKSFTVCSTAGQVVVNLEELFDSANVR